MIFLPLSSIFLLLMLFLLCRYCRCFSFFGYAFVCVSVRFVYTILRPAMSSSSSVSYCRRRRRCSHSTDILCFSCWSANVCSVSKIVVCLFLNYYIHYYFLVWFIKSVLLDSCLNICALVCLYGGIFSYITFKAYIETEMNQRNLIQYFHVVFV